MEEINKLEAKDRIILALDVDNIEETVKYVDMLKESVGLFKVGLPLCTACGVEALDARQDHGGKI